MTNEIDVYGVPEEAYELQSRIRRFMDEVVIPAEGQVAPHDWVKLDQVTGELRARAEAEGLSAVKFWEEWRQRRLGWRVRHLILEEVGRSALGAAALQCAPPDMPNLDLLDQIGDARQQRVYRDPLAKGQCRSCFAMTEPAPGAGSDPTMLLTFATRTGSGWTINGHKWFASGALGARFGIVIAQTRQGPTMFLVDTDNPGWKLRRELRALDGFQLGVHGEIELVDCKVGDDARLGEVGKALGYAQLRLEPARLAHCMRMIGRAYRVMDLAQQYIAARTSFGASLQSLQAVQGLVADAHIELHAARLMTWQVAAKMDLGELVKQDSALAKVFVSEAVGRVADRAVQLAGASGTLIDGPIAQFYQEVRPFRIYDGATEVHKAAIGRRILRQAISHNPRLAVKA